MLNISFFIIEKIKKYRKCPALGLWTSIILLARPSVAPWICKLDYVKLLQWELINNVNIIININILSFVNI